MLLNVLDGNLPSSHRMAAVTFRAQLATMYVSVAIGACVPDLREHQFDVAPYAGHRFVHAAQWIFGLVMIKVGKRA
jgi:hypothetical protein